MKYQLVSALSLSTVALGLLGACSVYDSITSYMRSDKASTCPDAAILTGTSILSAFNPAAEGDPSGELYTVAMTGVLTRCDYSKSESTADSRVKIFLHATRPPNGRVPYYVAVASAGDILDKKIYWMDIKFPAGTAASDFNEVVESTVIKVAKDKKVYDYHLVVGFQLTKAQLDYNNKMGRYTP
jgi:hypothetical protein